MTLNFNSFPPEALLTTVQTARALTDMGLPTTEASLATRASRGNGPPFHKFGRNRIYRWSDVAAWGEASPNAGAWKLKKAAQAA
jgi:hypothetical protein